MAERDTFRGVDVATCPKSMVFGPCGGVRRDGSCEVEAHACPFLDDEAPRTWPAPGRRTRPFALPPVIVDVRPDVDHPQLLRRTAEQLVSHGFAALLGEHLDDPDPEHPHRVARRVTELGVSTIATVTPRGRTVEECANEIDDLLAAGVLAVHCVTGDHPASRFEPDATATFSLDGTRLADLARARGAFVTVAESPASPPREWRPERLLSKQRAGADAAILNHAGPVADLCEFARRCRDVGVTMPLVAPVPVVTDHRSARALTQFPGVVLPPGLLNAVLRADDPRQAGIDVAIEVGRALLASGEFEHLNLSGSASGHGTADRITIMTEVALGVRTP